MEKNMKQVRIVPVLDFDEYQVQVSLDGGSTWELCVAYRLHCSEYDLPHARPRFVSVRLFNELRRYVAFGYDYVLY